MLKLRNKYEPYTNRKGVQFFTDAFSATLQRISTACIVYALSIHYFIDLSSLKFRGNGNGKRHRTPSPESLKRIKRISFETFLNLKELFKNFRRPAVIELKRCRKKPIITAGKPAVVIQNYATGIYEPSRINDAFNSLFWQWRRVAEWHRYINDPYENISGHMTT